MPFAMDIQSPLFAWFYWLQIQTEVRLILIFYGKVRSIRRTIASFRTYCSSIYFHEFRGIHRLLIRLLSTSNRKSAISSRKVRFQKHPWMWSSSFSAANNDLSHALIGIQQDKTRVLKASPFVHIFCG